MISTLFFFPVAQFDQLYFDFHIENQVKSNLTSSNVGMIFSRISPTVFMSALMLRMLHISPADDRAAQSKRQVWGAGMATVMEEQYIRSENSWLTITPQATRD